MTGNVLLPMEFDLDRGGRRIDLPSEADDVEVGPSGGSMVCRTTGARNSPDPAPRSMSLVYLTPFSARAKF